MTNIYTDGSCLGNPGKGGWAYCVFDDDELLLEKHGCEFLTTNNIMELTAINEALEYAYEHNDNYTIYTDSVYVKQGINVWIQQWLKNGFKTSQNKDVKNKYLWMSINEKMEAIKDRVIVKWVKAHNGNPKNELVDKIARTAAESSE